MSKIIIRDLSKRFSRKAKSVVDQFSLEVIQGEIMVLIGDSGSGKTTVLRMIAGLEDPDTGSIRIGGRLVFGDGENILPEKRKVAMIFQDNALFPHFTVRENILFGLRSGSRTGKTEKLKTMLELTKLEGLEQRYPHELSGGQIQRVAIARALITSPELLLLDEPFNNLDFSLKIQMIEEIKELLKTTGTTSILVTHDRNEAFLMADRIAILKDGKILQVETPFDIYHKPVDPFTSRFFGKANLIPGILENGKVGTEVGEFNAENTSLKNGGVLVILKPEDFLFTSAEKGYRAEVLERKFFGHYWELKVQLDALKNPLYINLDGHSGMNHDPVFYILPNRNQARIVAGDGG